MIENKEITDLLKKLNEQGDIGMMMFIEKVASSMMATFEALNNIENQILDIHRRMDLIDVKK